MLLSDFHYSETDALNCDICRAMLLLAVNCERNGMVGVNTYRSREILAWLTERKDEFKNDKMIIFV